jgi:hypothetical protein
MRKDVLNWGTSFVNEYGATGNLAKGEDNKPLAKDGGGKYAAANKTQLVH